MTKAIQVKDLTKVYGGADGGVLAVDRVSFAVEQGEVFGFLGPNGAGKTTTIRLLTGLSRPSSGQASVLGLDLFHDLPLIKKQIGVVPETSNLYDELSTRDNLIFSMQLYGVPRAERAARAEKLLTRFRLQEKRDSLFAQLSRGMKRSLTIAAALAHRPHLVFLDEPTTGLDVMSARDLRQQIAGLREEGVTVFLTTHYLEEAERLCDRIALVVKGQVVALDTVAALKGQVQEATAVEITTQKGIDPQLTRRRVGEDLASLTRQALDGAEAEGQRVLSIRTVQPTLEDVFVQLTGLSAEVMQAEKPRKGK
jgi:ABC-2 type transport system ATP-binding protein